VCVCRCTWTTWRRRCGHASSRTPTTVTPTGPLHHAHTPSYRRLIGSTGQDVAFTHTTLTASAGQDVAFTHTTLTALSHTSRAPTRLCDTRCQGRHPLACSHHILINFKTLTLLPAPRGACMPSHPHSLTLLPAHLPLKKLGNGTPHWSLPCPPHASLYILTSPTATAPPPR
jgi:plastocyanin